MKTTRSSFSSSAVICLAATDTITATPATGCSVAITVNDTAIESGDSVTWETGENTVVAVVTRGTASRTYTVTVTKS